MEYFVCIIMMVQHNVSSVSIINAIVNIYVYFQVYQMFPFIL